MIPYRVGATDPKYDDPKKEPPGSLATQGLYHTFIEVRKSGPHHQVKYTKNDAVQDTVTQKRV